MSSARTSLVVRSFAVALVVSVLSVLFMVTAANALVDRTVTRKARLHQQFRAGITLTEWRRSPHGRAISWRESHNVCSAVSPTGAYRGKWQMSRSLWRAYGGRRFARVANRATCREQDRVARRIWVDAWWSPWDG